MARVSGYWTNQQSTLVTTKGIYTSLYHPGEPNEWVTVWGPDGKSLGDFRTPALGTWTLLSIDGKLWVYYLRNNKDGTYEYPVPVPTAIDCGAPVAWQVTGGTGPVGPVGPQGDKGDKGDTGAAGADGAPGDDAVALTPEQIDAIARRVWTLPAGEYTNISGLDLGTMAQESTVYPFTQRQDLYQRAAHRAGEALANMVKDGNLPPVPE